MHRPASSLSHAALQLATLAVLLSGVSVGCDGAERERASTQDSYGAVRVSVCKLLVRCGQTPLLKLEDCDDPSYACEQAPLPDDANIEGAARCKQALDGLACEDVELDALPDACHTAFVAVSREVGESQPGQGCLDTSECGYGLTCTAGYGDEACGTCVADPEEGEECGPNESCAAGLYCAFDMRCRRLQDLGQACSSDDACAVGHCKAGQCSRTLRGVGAVLSDDEECERALIEIDQVCLKPAGAGEACVAGQCLWGNTCEDGRCAPVKGCGQGRSGDPCAASAHCAEGLSCNYDSDDEDGTCRPDEHPEIQIGAACDSDDECDEYQHCSQGRCSEGSSCQHGAKLRNMSLLAPRWKSRAAHSVLRSLLPGEGRR